MKSLASVRGTPAPGGRLLAPQDREAFSLSRGFPYLMVPATAFWHTWNLSAPFFMVKL